MKLPSILQLIRAPFLPSDPMARAKLCLDTLRADWETRHKAWKAGQTHKSFVGDINWHTYAKKHNLTEQQIFDYCETLPRLQLIHPTCPICSQPWYDYAGGVHDDMSKARPVSNGNIISWVDYVETFCVCQDDNDDDIWYHQSKEGKCSFNRNININNEHIELRWNCNCLAPLCYNKNILVWHKYISRDNYDYITLKVFDADDPILTAPREKVWEVAEKLMLLI